MKITKHNKNTTFFLIIKQYSPKIRLKETGRSVINIKEINQIENYYIFESDIERVLSSGIPIIDNLSVIVTIDSYEFSFINKLSSDSEVRRYFLTLSNYPNMSDWELHQLYLFIKYENDHNRRVGIWCANRTNTKLISNYMNTKNHIWPEKPNKLTTCTACKQNGCLTDFVMHIASFEDSMNILRTCRLLSARCVQNIVGNADYINERNAVGDPDDYSDYIMFGWGNCQSGDRIVVERKVGHFPSDREMEKYYEPAPRFYFNYSEIIKHETATFDGYHPVKIKHELDLINNLHLCVIPLHLKHAFEKIADEKIKDRIVYIPYNNEDIWDWSEKAYNELLLQN